MPDGIIDKRPKTGVACGLSDVMAGRSSRNHLVNLGVYSQYLKDSNPALVADEVAFLTANRPVKAFRVWFDEFEGFTCAYALPSK